MAVKRAAPTKVISSPEEAFEFLKARLPTMDKQLSRGRVDYEGAANTILSAVEFCSAPAQVARFESLPKDEWDPTSLLDARHAALAVRHCRAMASSADARETRALVPASVVDEVAALKRKALKVLGYWVDDAEVQADLADIGSGTGYDDATEDLERLATLLVEHEATISDNRFDPKATAARARQLADLISGAARANSAAEWQQHLRRAFTLALAAYGEVQAAATFLFRKEPLKAARVGSVFSRPRRSKKAVVEPVTPE